VTHEVSSVTHNVEIKARVTDLSTIRLRTESVGATRLGELRQTDTFFNVPGGRLKLRDFEDGTGELIYYERADVPDPKVSNYTRVPVSDPAALRDVLARALGVCTTVRKHRTAYMLGQTRIHLDEVEGLGWFVELEVARRSVQQLATPCAQGRHARR
jgi:predicted adenylyl cyclase CyaB